MSKTDSSNGASRKADPLARDEALSSSKAVQAEPFRLASIPAYGWVIVAMSILGLGVLPWIIGKSPVTSVATPDSVTERVLTTKLGVERFPVLSPDGRKVAYVWENEDGQTDLYVRMVDAEQHIQLTNSAETEESPVWSPDGLVIGYFVRTGPGQRALRIIPALGGRTQTRATIEVPMLMDEARSMSTGLSWFPGGEWVAFSRRAKAPATMEIVAMSLATGEVVRLTEPPNGALDVAPAVSPDGQTLAFMRNLGARNGQLYVTPIDLAHPADDLAAPVPLYQATPWDTDPVWSLDGQELIFSGGRWPRTRLWSMPLDESGEAAPLSGTGLGGGSPSIALARLPGVEAPVWRMVYSAVDLDNDVFTISLDDGALVPFQGSSQRERYPEFGGGEELFFLSDRSGFREVWSADSPTASAVQWTQWESGYIWRPSWSRAAGLLAYCLEIDGKLTAWVQDQPMGGQKQLTPDGAMDDDIAWSLDGRRLYTTSPDRNPQGRALYALSLEGGSAELLAVGNGRPLGENPETGELLIRVHEAGNNYLKALNLASGESRDIALDASHRHSFAPGPDGIYFVAVSDLGAEIRKWSYAGESETSLLTLENEPENGLAVDDSGKTVALAFINVLRGDLILAEGLQ